MTIQANGGQGVALPPGTEIVGQMPTSAVVNGVSVQGYQITVRTVYGDTLRLFVPASVYRNTDAVAREIASEVTAANNIRALGGNGS